MHLNFQRGDKLRVINWDIHGVRTCDIVEYIEENQFDSSCCYVIGTDGARHSLRKSRFEFANCVPASTSRKDDAGKLDTTLLDDMPLALKAVVEVMQWAVTEKQPKPYERGSWQGVHADRYRAAILRHNRDACEQSKATGVEARFETDYETKMLHLAHIATSALMALENTLREQKGNKNA